MTLKGVTYKAIDTANLPFGNACNHCVFGGTACYDETDFSCHSDSRADEREVYFIEVMK